MQVAEFQPEPDPTETEAPVIVSIDSVEPTEPEGLKQLEEAQLIVALGASEAGR